MAEVDESDKRCRVCGEVKCFLEFLYVYCKIGNACRDCREGIKAKVRAERATLEAEKIARREARRVEDIDTRIRKHVQRELIA